jgi:hypothetical protein
MFEVANDGPHDQSIYDDPTQRKNEKMRQEWVGRNMTKTLYNTYSGKLLSHTGDISEFTLGNEFENGIQHGAQDRNIEPGCMVGHIETGHVHLL